MTGAVVVPSGPDLHSRKTDHHRGRAGGEYVRGLCFGSIGALILSASVVEASPEADRIRALRMPSPIIHTHIDLARATRRAPSGKTVSVIVRLSPDRDHASFMSRAASISGRMKEIGRVRHVLNAVFLEVDRDMLPMLAKDPAVVRIAEVADYEIDLADTVPYIGGTVLHAQGFDGTGVRVAVIDSGIDYLHANLGGSGDPAEFEANDPTVIEPGTFPTSRVIGGYDFVGQTWP